MSPAIIYRPAVSEDISSITALLIKLNQEEGNDSDVNGSALAHDLFGKDRRMNVGALIAEDTGTVIAVALYYLGYDVLTTAYGYHLSDIVVEGAYRRKGIATKLIGHLAAQNMAEGGEWISLTVLSKNEAARMLYNQLGMVHVPVEFFAGGKRTLTRIAQQAGV
jgi:ribosomal protein S18 acetylase RimI-like enzyme